MSKNLEKEKGLQRRTTPYEMEEESPGHLDRIEGSRAEKQVEAMVILAKRFPRDLEKAKEKVLAFCRLPEFAEKALYAYPRGGQDIVGPSIRLAESIAQAWGNMLFGIQEVGRKIEGSELRAYCWDLESNTWAERVFIVPHVRYTKEKGNTALYDPRDIYENLANQGARRLRACILSQLPVDIKEEFTEACLETQKKAALAEKLDVEKVVKAFVALKPTVTKADLEKLLGHPLAAMTAEERVKLLGIHTALKDGIAKKADYFGPKAEGPGEKEQGSGAKEEPQEAVKSDEDKTEAELRTTLVDLMTKQGKDKAWLQGFYGVADVKVETVPRGFLEEGIAALRKDALGKGIEIVEEGDENGQ